MFAVDYSIGNIPMGLAATEEPGEATFSGFKPAASRTALPFIVQEQPAVSGSASTATVGNKMVLERRSHWAIGQHSGLGLGICKHSAYQH